MVEYCSLEYYLESQGERRPDTRSSAAVIEPMEKYSEGKINKSELARTEGRQCKNTVYFIHQEKYSNQLHGVCLRQTRTRVEMFAYI